MAKEEKRKQCLCLGLPRHFGGVFLVLLEMTARLTATCPSSCVVCSGDVTVCQGLPYILAAPDTTRALIVTDGYITTIEFSNLSILINLALLRLSSNSITEIQEGAFSGFTDLRALVLDQNQLSSSAISDDTFGTLRTLELLVLSSNILSNIYGTWFSNMKNLVRLQLNGNQLTNVTDNSFGTTSLYHLKNLDLSNNLINYIDKYAFLGLPQLQELDLSRNNLKHISNAFFPLTRLLLLNLDQNQWNCTCELQELAAFLRNYISSSARILKNAKYMECWNSDNWKVHSVLELSEGNCLPATHNITIIVHDKNKDYYLRDLILVAVFCFIGAVGLTFLVIGIYNGKLLFGKTDRNTPEHCSCECVNEFECAPGQTNHLRKRYQDCHITQENETKVMSIEGQRNDFPLMKRNSHWAAFQPEYKSEVLNLALRKSRKKKEQHREHGCFVCLNCGMLQPYPTGPCENALSAAEAELLSQHFHRVISQRKDLSSTAGWEDLESNQLWELSNSGIGIDEDQLIIRSSKPEVIFAGKELGLDMTRECEQPPSVTEERLTHPWERPDAKESLVATSGVASEEDAMRRGAHKQRSQLGGHGVRLDQSLNASVQPDNTLICKYMDCEQMQNGKRQKGDALGETVKTQAENTLESCFMDNDKEQLPHVGIKAHPLKSVRFYIPEQKHGSNAVNTSSSGTKLQNNLFRKNNKREMVILESDSNKRSRKGRQVDEQLQTAGMGKRGKISKPTKRKHNINTTVPDFLHVKINMHPFRKVRIHPSDPNIKTQLLKQSRKGYKVQRLPHMAQPGAPLYQGISAAKHNSLCVQKETGDAEHDPGAHEENKNANGKGRRNPKTLEEERGSENTEVIDPPKLCETTQGTALTASVPAGNSAIAPSLFSKASPLYGESGTLASDNCNALDKEPSVSSPVNETIGYLRKTNTESEADRNAEHQTDADGDNARKRPRPNLPKEGTEANTEVQQTITASGSTSAVSGHAGADLENEPLESVDANPVKLATILMVLNIKKTNEAINMSQGNNTDLQINSNGQVHKDSAANMQEVQSNQPGKVNSAQPVSEMPLGGGEVLSALQGLKDISSEAENEALLIPSKLNEPEKPAPKPTQQQLTDSPSEEKQSEENNSNNNRCALAPSMATPATSSALSERSKVMILGGGSEGPMNVTQYLTERSKHAEAPQNDSIADPNEPHPLHREGSQKKKICLVLPEQINSTAQSINRKIK